MKSISITQDERKLIYAVLNNEQKNSHFKYEKLKKFLSFFNKNRNDKGKDCTTSHDFVGLIDKGLIELEKPAGLSGRNNDHMQNNVAVCYKLTNMGLLHIFNGKFIYSPGLLVRYHDEIVLKDLLYKYFDLKTIRSSSAKFFVLISEYLYDISSYLLGYRHTDSSPLTSEIIKEIEHNLNLITLILGFKVAIQFKESNLISSTFENNSYKAISALYDTEIAMKKNLSRDPKLLSLVSNVLDELSSAHAELLSLSKTN